MTELIFREPQPTRRPFMVGRMPSVHDGRVLDFAAGYTPDGDVRQETTDRGAIRDSDDSFFYLCVFGGTLSMTQGDMHECVEAMVERRRERARQAPRVYATAEELKQKVADLVESVEDAKVGRTKFAVGEKTWAQ